MYWCFYWVDTDNGGIYLDTDIIVLKSFDALRRHRVTLGRETSYGLGSGIILSQPRAAFVCMWLHAFRDYSPLPWHWATYAVWTPHRLAHALSASSAATAAAQDEIYIDERHLQHPTWLRSEQLFDTVYDWSENYAVHVWKRYGRVPESPDDVKRLNTTLGQVMRFVYFGSKDLILDAGETKPNT